MSRTGTAAKSRSASDTTIADLLRTVCPPRSDTTGCHVVAVGQEFLLVIQGPEAHTLVSRVLTFIDSLHEQSKVVEARLND